MSRSSTAAGPVDPETDPFLLRVDAAIQAAGPVAGEAPVTLPAAALAAAAFDGQAARLDADARFGSWFDAEEAAQAAADWLRGPREPALATVATPDGATTVLLLGRPADAEGWALPTDLRRPLAAPGAACAAIGYRPFEDPVLAERAMASWRLTPLEARTVHGLISAGDLIGGAKLAGVGYETVRKALRLALKKAGAARQSDLVRRLHLAVGGGDVRLSDAPKLAEALGLGPRASRAAVLIALGLTRPETAATLGVSENAVKDELNALFLSLRLRSATDLSRLATEALALLGLAQNPNVAVAGGWSTLRPLRFVNRPGQPGRIALSDFGPASGEPVLLFHSATTGALLDRGLVRALQKRGLRPIALERPGFGLTDPPERGHEAGAALEDVLTVMAALGLKRVRIVARSGEKVALEFGRRHPERLIRGVLINPFTPKELDQARGGLLNQAKWTFMSRPELIEPAATFLAQRTSRRVLERLTREALRGSAPDQALLDRPEVMEDYVESCRIACLRTTWGFIHEQREFTDWRLEPLPDGAAWTRIVGEQDVLYRPADSDVLWAAVLPGHRSVRVADGGRFIHASHPELVAEEAAG